MSDERYKVEVKYGDPREATVTEDPCYKPPDSEQWAEKLLESAGREATGGMTGRPTDDLIDLLKRRLLPFLEAGDLLCNTLEVIHGEETGSCKAWRAAKQKAMEGL